MTKDNLLQALKLCHPALSNNNLIRGLDSYNFNGLTVTAWNGAVSLISLLDEPFPINGYIEGESLFKLINGLEKEIELNSLPDGSLQIKSGKSKTLFPVVSVGQVLFEVPSDTFNVNLPTSDLFQNGIKRCMLSMSSKLKIEDAGIHMIIEDGYCNMYASNGITYTKFQFPFEQSSLEIFLPAMFCEQVEHLYSVSNTEPKEISVGEEHIKAEFDNVKMYCSFRTEPVNTQLTKYISAAIADTITTPIPESLLEVLKRAETISGDNTVTLSYNKDNAALKISAFGKGKQEFIEIIEMTYPSSVNITIDIKLIKRVLETCESIGFNEDFITLIGDNNMFSHVIGGKAE